MEYPSNSQSKQPRETPEKKEPIARVTQGSVVRKKKGLGRRFSETFMGGDARNAGSYVMFDVLLPAMRDMITDTVTMGVERMVYGEARPRGRYRGSSGGGLSGHTPYNRMSAGLRPDPREGGMSRRGRATHNFDEIVLDTRVEAEHVVDQMFHLLQKYGQVTITDLYDLVGETAAYTDNKWGWTELQGTDIRRTRDGYLIKLPPPIDL